MTKKVFILRAEPADGSDVMDVYAVAESYEIADRIANRDVKRDIIADYFTIEEVDLVTVMPDLD
jgi:uncharacterized membrane-anchored protein